MPSLKLWQLITADKKGLKIRCKNSDRNDTLQDEKSILLYAKKWIGFYAIIGLPDEESG
jgi:hypothetical protein